MSFNATSSQIGVDMNNTSTTQLFALGTKVSGTSNSEWTYVQASGAVISGEMCMVRTGGTAVPVHTTALAVGSTNAGELAWAQGAFADQDYGWMAKRGDNMSVLCSGTCAPNSQLYWAPGQLMGALTTSAGSATMFGVQLVVSASTASLVLTTAILTWPRAFGAIAVQ